MATFSVDFLGCKVSHSDAQAVRERLLADGHEERPGGDVAVVNTCCVTHEALRKSRHAASRAARTHRRVFVTGCGANLAPDAFAGLPDNVTVIAKRSEETPGAVAGDVGAIGCVQADARLDRIRAFVKVQDGCSFSCNFCVIPFVRGASRSRRAGAVIAEVRRRVEQGHREVVLTGINLGCYRDREAGYDLPRLIREVGATPGLARLRLSSIEVNHLTEALVAALLETPTVSRHLHVPLQSGDDGVLRAMARRYDAATYLRRVGARGRLQPDDGRDRGVPRRGRCCIRPHGRGRARVGGDQGARLPLLASAGNGHGSGRHGAEAGEEGAQRTAARAVARGVPAALAREARYGGRRPGRPAGTGVRRRLHAVARRRAGRRARPCSRGGAVTDEGILAA